eukprot:3261846-Rhodomonas_salina.1
MRWEGEEIEREKGREEGCKEREREREREMHKERAREGGRERERAEKMQPYRAEGSCASQLPSRPQPASAAPRVSTAQR